MPSLVEALAATDPVSGIVAPVAVRTLRGHGAEPIFILLGDKPMVPGDGREVNFAQSEADASKLFWAFYSTLPGDTFKMLIRQYLAEWAKGNLLDKPTSNDHDALTQLLRKLDSIRPVTLAEIDVD